MCIYGSFYGDIVIVERPIAPEPGSEHSVDSGNDKNEVDGLAAERERKEEVVEIAQNIVQVVLQQAQQQG